MLLEDCKINNFCYYPFKMAFVCFNSSNISNSFIYTKNITSITKLCLLTKPIRICNAINPMVKK